MTGKKICLYCGKPVGPKGYCLGCGLGQDFLRKADNTSLYYYNMGLDRARVHDLTGAIEALGMSLRYNKSNIDSRNLLGLIYYEMGETVSALSHWVISVNYRPRDNFAVRYLKELKDNPKTLELSDELSRSFNKALQLAKNKEFDLAVIQLNKCISGNRNFVKAYLLLALISIEQRREGMAKKYLSQVIAIDRGNPTALHLLREIGESAESVSQIIDNNAAEAAKDNADTLFDGDDKDSFYGMEERPAVKLSPSEVKGGGAYRVRINKTRDSSFIWFSNLYMLAGIIIGAAVFFFLFSPGIKSKYTKKINEMQRAYNSTLSSRNSEIESLQLLAQSADDKTTGYVTTQKELQEENERLKAEIETLKAAIEAGGGSVVIEGQQASGDNTSDDNTSDESSTGEEGQNLTGVGHNPNHVDNAAADRNNANVRGIDKNDIESLIQSE